MLTQDQVKAIRARYMTGEKISALGREYACGRCTIDRHVKDLRHKVSIEMDEESNAKITSEGKQQSYRENLAWAIDAAGEFIRTKNAPKTCPNNSAWFLYCQAIKDPKDFHAKVSSIEKGADDALDKEVIKSTRKTLGEIEHFLERLDEKEKDKAPARVSNEVRQLQGGTGANV
jgi:hypothetical protein